MNWIPRTKQITDLSPILVRQELERGGGELSCPSPLSFTWDDLVLSLARTTALLSEVRELSPEDLAELVRANGTNLAIHMNLFIDTHDAEFLFTTKANILADEQRTSFAAKVGAAVADLVMQRMGFYWSANARELDLKLSSHATEATKRIPDFVYDPAGEHGFQPQSVVVVEAKGSLSKQRAKRGPILKLAQDAYNGQVRHIIGAKGKDLTVASGYAIAFGTIPGQRASTLAITSPQSLQVGGASAGVLARSLSAASSYEMRPRQPSIAQRGGSGEPPDGGYRREGERRAPSGRIAYANYESVFLLCGATGAARVIRNILSGQGTDILAPEHFIQDFWVFEHRGKRFWTSLGQRWWPGRALFAIYEPSAEDILRSVSNNLDAVPVTVSLTVASIADDAEFDRDFDIAVQGDGLALLRTLLLPGEHRNWDLRNGDWL
jgi:hypothetical protein